MFNSILENLTLFDIILVIFFTTKHNLFVGGAKLRIVVKFGNKNCPKFHDFLKKKKSRNFTMYSYMVQVGSQNYIMFFFFSFHNF
jgi:hypothetical protein